MGRSVSRFDPESAPERFDDSVVQNPASGVYYRAVVRGDTLFQQSWRVDSDGRRYGDREYPVELVIGSGNATRSYLMNVAGMYTEMPLTWYVDRQGWDVSPGYEQRDQAFSRPITLECMTCHNALPEHSTFTQNHYRTVPLGISCERCHGPGSRHVDRALAGLVDDSDSTVVNPARLPRDRQLSICQQCHLTGVSVFETDEDPTTFMPGEPIAAHRSVFVEVEETDSDAAIGIASHGTRLALSECFVNSEMTCTTCHDPHVPVSDAGEDYFNEACATCHTPGTDSVLCSREVSVAADRTTGDCAGCHMPKSGTSDIPHVTFTDHWIRPVRTSAPTPSSIDRIITRTSPMSLMRVTDDTAFRSAENELDRAIAYLSFYDTIHRLPAYLDSVRVLAQRGLNYAPNDADGRLALGRALLESGEAGAAVREIAEAATIAPDNALAAYWHAVALQRDGRVTEALNEIERAIGIQPLSVESHIKRGDLLAELGRTTDAGNAYRDAINIDPVHHPAAYNNLGFLMMQEGRFAPARDTLAVALRLAPDDEVALLNAGTVEMLDGQWESAEAVLLRATELHPESIGAYGNLGQVYMQQNRIEDARRMFRRVLEIDPTDARARALLLQLERDAG